MIPRAFRSKTASRSSPSSRSWYISEFRRNLPQVLPDVLLERLEHRLVDGVPELVLALGLEDGDVRLRLVHPDALVLVEVRDVEPPSLDEVRRRFARDRFVEVGLSEARLDLPQDLGLDGMVRHQPCADPLLRHPGRIVVRVAVRLAVVDVPVLRV
jgi:hypothetical protein